MTAALAGQERLPEMACDHAGQNRNYAVLVEGMFAFVFKGARRLLELSPEEARTIKRLAVEFMTAPEKDRPQILETMMEIAFPDEQIGGIDEGARCASPQVRARLKASREYVGGQIRQFRESRGWTQAMFARKAKIPQSHVSRLECGRLAPTRKTIERVAKVLKVDPAKIDPGYHPVERI